MNYTTEVVFQSVTQAMQKLLSSGGLLNTTPFNGEQSKSGDFLYYQVLSPSNAEKLIRYWTEKGIENNDIALFCGNDFLLKVKLYCGGEIKAEVNPEEINHHVNYKIGISTKQDKYIEYPRHKKILLNLDNKIVTEGWDEVYSYYTKVTPENVVKEYPLFKQVSRRNWKTLFSTYPKFYRRNYMYLTYNHFYNYITLRPEVVGEDGLWLPNFTFTSGITI
jgi:hypothetical protein